MPESAFTPRRMTASDWPAVESSFAHAFMDCRPTREWDWRYRQPIEDRKGPCWYGWVSPAPDGSIAAYMGGRLLRGWLDGEVQDFILSQDNFSHPRWRGRRGGQRGVFSDLEAAFIAACGEVAALGLGMAQERRARLGVQLGHIHAFTGGQWFQALCTKPRAPGASSWLALTDFRDEAWDELWDQRRQSCRWSLVRDQKFLSWRFDPRQGRTYWRMAIHGLTRKPGQPLGYIVLSPGGPEHAILVDAVLPESTYLARDAWQQVVAWLYRRGIRQVTGFFSRGCPEYALLPALGFSPCPAPRPVVPSYAFFRTFDHARFNHEYAYTLADCDLY